MLPENANIKGTLVSNCIDASHENGSLSDDINNKLSDDGLKENFLIVEFLPRKNKIIINTKLKVLDCIQYKYSFY